MSPASSSSKKTVTCIYVLLLLLSCSGCGVTYYTNAGYQQFRILLSRRSIDTAIQNPDTNPELKRKLHLARTAREFSRELGLQPRKTFRTYATRKNIPEIWVLTAAKKYQMEPYLWKFPVVGRLPYKGFFSKKDAEREKEKLAREGYDVALRTTAAYSTLGWFNDPLMPATLALDDLQLFNTVVHEITHTTLWIPGSISFNETFAHTVGLLGTLVYFTSHAPEEHSRDASYELFLKECAMARGVTRTKERLTELFSSPLSQEEMEIKKLEIYSESGLPPNNALFLGYQIYYDRFHYFLLLFNNKKDISEYITAVKEISNEDDKKDPFTALRSYLSSIPTAPDPEDFHDTLCKDIIALIRTSDYDAK
jgi:predicted aminopeptidase